MFTGSLMKKQMYKQPMEGHKGCNTYRFLSQEEQSLQCIHIMHIHNHSGDYEPSELLDV